MWNKEFPSQLKIVQTLLPKPDRFRSRFTVALATEKPAEACKHARVLVQSRRCALEDRPLANECGQCLPFILFTEDRARHVGNFTAKFR